MILRYICQRTVNYAKYQPKVVMAPDLDMN